MAIVIVFKYKTECSHKCGTCENTRDYCMTCSDTNRIMGDNNTCNAKDGYYDDGSSAAGIIC